MGSDTNDKKRLRAWVMIVRNRVAGDFKDLEVALAGLVPEFGPDIKFMHTVYGHYDVVIAVETDTLSDLHDFIQTVQRFVKRHARSTTTFLAVERDSEDIAAPASAAERRFPIGINCEPRAHKKIQALLHRLDEVIVADIVLGTFDLIAMVRRPDGKGKRGEAQIHELLNEIARTEGITKTTTMLDCERLDP